MGGFIPDGFGEATINMDFIAGPSNPMAMVFGYSHAGVNPSGHAQVLAEAFRDSVMTITPWSNNLLVKDVSCKENPGGVSGSFTISQPGISADKALPPQICVLVRKNTDQGGRPGRGRMYMPGLTDAQTLEGGFIVPSSVTLINGEFGDFRTSIGLSDLPMVVLHSNPALAPANVITLSVQDVLATQRRRIR